MMLGLCQVVAAGQVALLPGLREPRRRVNQFLLPDPRKDGGHGVVGREPVLGKNTGAERLTRHVVGYLIEAPLFIPGTTVACFFETSEGPVTLQASLEQPNYAYFANAELPKLLTRPMGQAAGTLGVSTVTLSGIR
jgi:hypothetical protein